jgi:hypothetical protein
MPFCDTGRVELAYPKPEYGVKIKMTGPDGREVSKTTLGKSFGSKFDQLREFTDSRLDCIDAWGPYRENPGLGGGRPLPRPEDLFKMRDPGAYTLTVEMQMFHRAAPGSNDKYWTLFRFPPVTIHVEGPPKR